MKRSMSKEELATYWMGKPDTRQWVRVKETGERGVLWDGASLAYYQARDLYTVTWPDRHPTGFYKREELDFE